MIKRILQHFIKNGGLPWLLVGILLTTLWTGADIAGASSALKRLLSPGDPPTMVNYQGLVNLSGVPYDGTGYFKFAVVDSASGDGSTNHWANDGTASGEPSTSITRTVSSGLFNVLLGDTSITGMTQSITHTAFAETDTYLRVWFSQSGVSFDALAPNQRLASVPYALRAQYAESAGPQVSFSAYLSSDQALPAASQTTIVFDAKQYDDGNNFDTATNAFTAPTDGVYYFETALQIEQETADGTRYDIEFWKNGGRVQLFKTHPNSAGGSLISISGATLLKLNAGDVITIRLMVLGSGRNIHGDSGSLASRFSGFQVY